MNNLEKQYQDYVDLITGKTNLQNSPIAPLFQFHGENSLEDYQNDYLKDQVLHWGGVITGMFPKTCQLLKEEGVSLDAFCSFFYRLPRSRETPYDFFKIKLDRFKEFVLEIREGIDPPGREKLLTTVHEETNSLWEAYLLFNPPD
jgi:hypothetical protein